MSETKESIIEREKAVADIQAYLDIAEMYQLPRLGVAQIRYAQTKQLVEAEARKVGQDKLGGAIAKEQQGTIRDCIVVLGEIEKYFEVGEAYNIHRVTEARKELVKKQKELKEAQQIYGR